MDRGFERSTLNGWPLSWSTLEGILSGRDVGELRPVNHQRDSAAEAPPQRRDPPGPEFAELHACSAFHFLRGASQPAALANRAAELGMKALALTDRDGLYGAVQFAEAAGQAGIASVFGAELTTDDAVLTVLARGAEGYRRLSRAIAAAHMATGEKDEVAYPPLPVLGEQAAGHWQLLVPAGQASLLPDLLAAFGPERVALEYRVTMTPQDADDHELLDRLRSEYGLRAVISAVPTAASRKEARLAGAKAALARRESLGAAESELHPTGGTWLRSAQTILRAAPGREDLVATAAAIAEECSFTLDLVAPNLPKFPTPEGEMAWLAGLTRKRAKVRYASRPEDVRRRAREQIDRELAVIEELDFPGYFLIVCDLVDYARSQGILCQGRGSAANSAVCFALGITNVEPIQAGLLFERFLSPERDGPPDIDVDFESTRREEVIQYAYRRYGRENAAQVANVITYRTKGAVPDAARALGYPQGAIDAWARGTEEAPEDVEKLAAQFLGQPRHLGIHSGGMVICDRPIADVVPTEWARMAGRSVVQWDKDDCAAAGLVKFDLLGLGMLEALHHAIDLVAEHRGVTVRLWELDLADEGVYAMLRRADAVGVFQVESRAQMATLPRLKPRVFFDLVVEVALVRPGPIQGGSVHPFIRRRNGEEPVTYDHPCLEPALAKTLGVPLFQEQLMQMARDAAGFSGAEADALRRAMGSKRSPERMAQLKSRFYQGVRDLHGIGEEVADKLWNKMMAFAAYGFPESHSQSFAAITYYSAWFKLHYPAEFCVALLRAQPMGFYSPQSLVADARRHGVPILPVSVAESGVEADCPGGAIRLGLGSVKGLGEAAARRIVAAREGRPLSDAADLARRADLDVAHLEALAKAGALDCFGVDRRQALWQAGVAATERAGMLPGLSAIQAPALPGMSAFELMAADVAATGVTPQQQPMALLRDALAGGGVVPAGRLLDVPDGTRVRVAGVVTHRQHPMTAGGVTFLGMEDETGLMNVIVSEGLWNRQRKLALTSKALVIRGIVENASGAVSIVADKLEPLVLGEVLSRGSRDFR